MGQKSINDFYTVFHASFTWYRWGMLIPLENIVNLQTPLNRVVGQQVRICAGRKRLLAALQQTSLFRSAQRMLTAPRHSSIYNIGIPTIMYKHCDTT